MLPPFPIQNIARPPYRFLDTYGLPNMPGDVSRFGAAHIRLDAGAALRGVWRPVDATEDAVPAIQQGCLTVTAAPSTRVAAHIAAGLEIDVVVEVSPPFGFVGALGSLHWGVYVGIGDTGHGVLLSRDITVTSAVTDSNGPVTKDKPVTFARGFTVDLSDAGLPLTIDDFDTSSDNQPVVGPEVVLVRIRRVIDSGSSTVTGYVSCDGGHAWFQVYGSIDIDDATLSTIGVLVTGGGGLTPKATILGVKFLNPALALGL